MNRSQFIDYLINRTLLKPEHKTLLTAVPSSEDLCCYIVKNAWVDAEILAKTLASDFGFVVKDINKNISEFEKQHQSLICKHTAIPIKEEESISLVLADPNNLQAIIAFEQALNQKVQPI